MSVSLASMNLHCGRSGDGTPYSVRDALAALDADVVVVQENWRPVGERSLAEVAAAECGYSSYTEVGMVSGSLGALGVVPGDHATGTWGMAVMSRSPWAAIGSLALGAAPGDVVGGRRALTVEVPVEGGLLRVVGTHLTHRLMHGPAQLRRLLRGLEGLDGEAGRAVPTVIAGDLNMCRPTVYLARGFRPALRGRSWPAHRPIAQIDHILAGPGVAATAASVGPDLGSDHRPVRAMLALTGVRAPALVPAA